MRFDLNKKLTKRERQRIEEINERLIKWIKETAQLFPNATYIFLFNSYKAISHNDEQALKRLITVLKLEMISSVDPYVWEALTISKGKWEPRKNREDVRTPDELLGYIRSIAWRKYHTGRLKEYETEFTIVFKDQDPLLKNTFKDMKKRYPYLKDELLLEIIPIETLEEPITDIEEIELLISIEQAMAKDKTINPIRATEIVELMKARVFAEATRTNIHEYLGCDKKKAQAIWREFSKKVKKNHIS